MLEVMTMMAVAEVHLVPAGIGELALFHDLQQHVVRFGMRLFDLIKDDDGIRAAADGFGELTGFFKADVSRRSAHQAADVVPFHEFRHIDLHQGVFAAKQEARQRLGEFGLAHTGGSEEHERADRTARVFQPGTSAAHGLGDGLDGFILADDGLAQFVFHVQQAFGFFGGQLHDGHARPHGNQFGNIFGGDHRAVGAVPAGAQFFDLCLQARLPGWSIPGRHRCVRFQPPRCGWRARSLSCVIRSLKVWAAGLLYMRTREEASSIRSMALSGKKRSVT